MSSAPLEALHGRLESPQSPDVVADLPTIATVAPPLRPLRLIPRSFGRDKHLLQSPPPPPAIASALDGVLDLASTIASAEPTSVYRLQTPARRRRPVSLPPPPKPQALVESAAPAMTTTLPIVVKPTRLVAHRRVEAISRSIDFGLPSAPSSVDHPHNPPPSLLPGIVTALPIIRRGGSIGGPARLPKDVSAVVADAVPTAATLPSISSVLSGFEIHYKRAIPVVSPALDEDDAADRFADAIEGDGEVAALALHGLGLGLEPRNVPTVTGLPEEDPPEVHLDEIEGHVHRIQRTMPTVAGVSGLFGPTRSLELEPVAVPTVARLIDLDRRGSASSPRGSPIISFSLLPHLHEAAAAQPTTSPCLSSSSAPNSPALGTPILRSPLLGSAPSSPIPQADMTGAATTNTASDATAVNIALVSVAVAIACFGAMSWLALTLRRRRHVGSSSAVSSRGISSDSKRRHGGGGSGDDESVYHEKAVVARLPTMPPPVMQHKLWRGSSVLAVNEHGIIVAADPVQLAHAHHHGGSAYTVYESSTRPPSSVVAYAVPMPAPQSSSSRRSSLGRHHRNASMSDSSESGDSVRTDTSDAHSPKSSTTSHSTHHVSKAPQQPVQRQRTRSGSKSSSSAVQSRAPRLPPLKIAGPSTMIMPFTPPATPNDDPAETSSDGGADDTMVTPDSTPLKPPRSPRRPHSTGGARRSSVSSGKSRPMTMPAPAIFVTDHPQALVPPPSPPSTPRPRTRTRTRTTSLGALHGNGGPQRSSFRVSEFYSPQMFPSPSMASAMAVHVGLPRDDSAVIDPALGWAQRQRRSRAETDDPDETDSRRYSFGSVDTLTEPDLDASLVPVPDGGRPYGGGGGTSSDDSSDASTRTITPAGIKARSFPTPPLPGSTSQPQLETPRFSRDGLELDLGDFKLDDQATAASSASSSSLSRIPISSTRVGGAVDRSGSNRSIAHDLINSVSLSTLPGGRVSSVISSALSSTYSSVDDLARIETAHSARRMTASTIPKSRPSTPPAVPTKEDTAAAIGGAAAADDAASVYSRDSKTIGSSEWEMAKARVRARQSMTASHSQAAALAAVAR